MSLSWHRGKDKSATDEHDKKGLGFIRVHAWPNLFLRGWAQSDSSSRPKLWVDLRSPETRLDPAGKSAQCRVVLWSCAKGKADPLVRVGRLRPALPSKNQALGAAKMPA